jgi:hypothetical protein
MGSRVEEPRFAAPLFEKTGHRILSHLVSKLLVAIATPQVGLYVWLGTLRPDAEC